MSCRSLILGLVAAVVLFSPGCGSTTLIQPGATIGGRAYSPVSSVAVSVPPGLDSKQFLPRDEEAMVKARLPLEDIVGTLPTPDFLSADAQRGDVASGSAPADGESPLAAQRFYMHGRQDWLEGRNFEAIDRLKDAYKIAPRSAAIARLLGRIHIQTNRIMAAHYLEKAVRLDPTDADSLFLLGNHALRQGRWEEAVIVLARALSLEEQQRDLDPAIRPLMQFDLAVSLEYAGYDQASIRQFTDHLEAPRHVAHASFNYRRLHALGFHRGSIWRRIGDGHHRLDQPARALEAYEKASRQAVPERWSLLSRLVYTHMRLGRIERARDLVVRRTGEAKADRRWFALLEYLADNGVSRAGLAKMLRRAYRENGRTPEMALSVVTLLEPEEARALLREHLSAKPGDRVVFAALIDLVLATEEGNVDPARAAEAIKNTATVIKALPAVTNRYTAQVLDQIADPETALAGIDRLGTPRPALRFLRGEVLARLGRSDEAAAQFQSVLKAQPGFEPALVSLARLLVGQERYAEAGRMLDRLTDNPDPQVVALRVEVLARTERTEEALQLLDRLIEAYPANLDLVLRKADLQIRLGDYVAAEYLMLDRLNVHPGEERLYEVLFHLYESYEVPDVQRQFSELMRRALLKIPKSWIARLKFAEFHMARGGADKNTRAEQLFRQLIVERPHDLRPLGGLLDLLWRTRRRTEANTMINERIEAESANPMLLQFAQQYYLRRDRKRFHEVSVLFLLTQPPSETRDIELSYRYLLLDQPVRVIEKLAPHLRGKPGDPEGLINLLRRAHFELGEADEAEKRIRDAITKFPGHEPDLKMQLAMLYDQTDRFEQAEGVMLDILEDHPDHAEAHNMLGYNWAVRGVNLERARVLIEKALADDPTNSAYRDSLGWVYYKMARFEDALRELKRARKDKDGHNPIILDHLGDAQYRVGNRQQALREWTLAQQLFHPELARLDSELQGLDVRIQEKVAAVGRGRKPAVAEVPVPPGDVPGQGREATQPYTVGEKESLFSIAAKLFGSPKLWVAIAKVNPDIKLNDLKPGQVIRIPSKVDGEFEDVTAPDGVRGQ